MLRTVATVKEKPLERAVRTADGYVSRQLLGVMKDMRGILKDKKNDVRARVAAGSEILKWAKPSKGLQINQNFNVPVNSKLGLPPAPAGLDESRILDVKAQKPVQKILPEPQRSIGESLRPFSARELGPGEVAMPEALPARSAAPRPPDRPLPISELKPYKS